VSNELIRLAIDSHIRFWQAFTGAYRSDIMLTMFASHLKITLKLETSHGHPVGALALCAAAVSGLLLMLILKITRVRLSVP
jgi:hypothetical protein